jgi:hypothetical protein
LFEHELVFDGGRGGERLVDERLLEVDIRGPLIVELGLFLAAYVVVGTDPATRATEKSGYL